MKEKQDLYLFLLAFGIFLFINGLLDIHLDIFIILTNITIGNFKMLIVIGLFIIFLGNYTSKMLIHLKKQKNNYMRFSLVKFY